MIIRVKFNCNVSNEDIIKVLDTLEDYDIFYNAYISYYKLNTYIRFRVKSKKLYDFITFQISKIDSVLSIAKEENPKNFVGE